MISLKTIQSSFSVNPYLIPFYHRNGLPKPNQKHSLLCLSKSSDDSPEPSSSPPPPEGDARKQEILFRMAMLQTEKVRLTGYLDERSDYLTKFAEDANSEIDKIGEEALKELDLASNSIMEKLDSRMQAFEESAEMNRVEIEEVESKLSEFEDQINKDRNEGLFFQGMGKKSAVDKDKSLKETKKIKEVTKASVGSKTRRNTYLALIVLPTIAIADAFLSTPPDWKKLAVLGAIWIGLVTQLIYEQGVSSEPTDPPTSVTEKSDEQNK